MYDKRRKTTKLRISSNGFFGSVVVLFVVVFLTIKLGK